METGVQEKTACAVEVAQGKRFKFGQNWSQFLTILTSERISVAEQSLQETLNIEHLQGKRFLDIGSGSGLFSLAARRLGATVHSFDYDPQATACTAELKRRYYPDDKQWRIEEGSALDLSYLSSLGTFDIVYSWGVLHHTGAMWQALDNVSTTVAPGGTLCIALYNDEGRTSRIWKRVKQLYNILPQPLKFLIVWPAFARLWLPTIIRDLLHARPFHSWRTYSSRRGMSAWRDVIDWVGGYPFEVAKPGDIFTFFQQKGFTLLKLKTTHDLGCNEYVFTKQE